MSGMALARRQVIGVALLVAGMPAPAARARPDVDEAAAVVRSFADRAIALLADEGLAESERLAAFQELIVGSFDLALTARLVLGQHWRTATPEQRAAFVELFERYVIATYGARLDAYGGETLEVQGAQARGERDALVRSRLHGPHGAPLAVDWRLRRGDDGWRIIDVVIANVSLAITHRSEFAAVINRKRGLDGLLHALRDLTGDTASGA
jgi:phospholipid transport system substrate-binding protein